MKNTELKILTDILIDAGYKINIYDFRYTLSNNGSVMITDRVASLEYSLNNIAIYKEDTTDKVITYLREKVSDLQKLKAIKDNSIFNQDIVELQNYIDSK